jgi:3-hydroxy-D-aspartate aldolase
LQFAGIQAYDGSAQHIVEFAARRDRIAGVVKQTADTVALLSDAGIACPTVGGAGTGTFEFEGASDVYNELQCGSYIFMDADYQRILGADNQPVSSFSNSLFVWTSIMSCAGDGIAVCDAGLKAHSIDSGMPVVFGRPDLSFHKCSDEHGVILDPGNSLNLNDRLRLVPGHCDPTCNLYDWYVGIRNDRVECVWPVSARGKVY